MNRLFEWGVVVATLLSVLSVVPRPCARLTYFFHPKLRKINVVLITPQLITLTLRRAGSIPSGKWGGSDAKNKFVYLKAVSNFRPLW